MRLEGMDYSFVKPDDQVADVSHNSMVQNISVLLALNDDMFRRLAPTVVVLVAVMVVGAVGNILVCYIFIRKLRRSSQNLFLLCLGIFDLLSSCIGVPSEIFDIRHYYFYESAEVCKAMRFLTTFPSLASILVLLVIAVDRYKKICKPLHHQIHFSHARIVIIVIVIIAVAFSVPAIYIYGHRSFPTPVDGVYGYDCSVDDVYKDRPYPLIYEGIFLAAFLVFTVILASIYMRIWLETRRHIKYLKTHATFGTALLDEATTTTSSLNYDDSSLENIVDDALKSRPNKSSKKSQHKGSSRFYRNSKPSSFNIDVKETGRIQVHPAEKMMESVYQSTEDEYDRTRSGKYGCSSPLKTDAIGSYVNNVTQASSGEVLELSVLEKRTDNSRTSIDSILGESESAGEANGNSDINSTKTRHHKNVNETFTSRNMHSPRRSQNGENVTSPEAVRNRTAGSQSDQSHPEQPAGYRRQTSQPESATANVKKSKFLINRNNDDIFHSSRSFQMPDSGGGRDRFTGISKDSLQLQRSQSMKPSYLEKTKFSSPNSLVTPKYLNVNTKLADFIEFKDGNMSENSNHHEEYYENSFNETSLSSRVVDAPQGRSGSLIYLEAQNAPREILQDGSSITLQTRTPGFGPSNQIKFALAPEDFESAESLIGSHSPNLAKNRARESQYSRSSQLAAKRVRKALRATRTTVIAFVITIGFILSYLPHLILIILRSIKTDFEHHFDDVSLIFYNIFIRSYFANNVINVFVYGTMNLEFRTQILNVWMSLKCLKK